MSLPPSERRQIENEIIFRRANELIGSNLDILDANHIADGNPHLVRSDDLLLHFKCECSDENCSVRLPMKLSIYRKIHENRNAFIIKAKQQVTVIEKVILIEEKYSVVEKNNSTAEPGNTLNITTIDNS
jgi:hypothetical protein